MYLNNNENQFKMDYIFFCTLHLGEAEEVLYTYLEDTFILYSWALLLKFLNSDKLK